jgi:hypothetical protein
LLIDLTACSGDSSPPLLTRLKLIEQAIAQRSLALTRAKRAQILTKLLLLIQELRKLRVEGRPLRCRSHALLGNRDQALKSFVNDIIEPAGFA